MKAKKATKFAAIALSAVFGCGALGAFAGCTNGSKYLVIMTQELNGLFNPFFSTSGTDMDVVGQTQLSMFSTDEEGKIAYGDDEAVIVKDYEMKTENGESVYYFVLKNGIEFSDGTPLTMEDVLFNMYVYLDPAYTGSTTMYSTKIVGLQTYRTQQNISGGGTQQDDALTKTAAGRAQNRLNELINLFMAHPTSVGATTYEADPDTMRAAIAESYPTIGYKEAIWPNGTPTAGDADAMAREQLAADYERVLELFREELENDFNAAKDAYQDEPYSTNTAGLVFDEVTSFMFMEGYIDVEYYKDPVTNKEDKNKIIKATKNYNNISNRTSAINYVYEDKISSALHQILSYYQTGTTLRAEFDGQARDAILHERVGSAGLAYPNIQGIRSLSPDHMPTVNGQPEETITSVDVNGHTYEVAQSHDEEGRPTSGYDVLRVRVTGTDPKAIWNFGFTVAPYHYYSDPSKYEVDIAKNKFGVDWGSFSFMQKVIQGDTPSGVSKNKVPLGAGPYMATDVKKSDSPAANGFFTNNTVYYKANHHFFENVEGANTELLHAPLIEDMCYLVVSSTNAINQLKSGGVHFVEPNYTRANAEILDGMESSGFKQVSSWQLGYGYIGINAGLVPNINIRKAIMSAMNTNLSVEYYLQGQALAIAWPMSLVSWAYPREQGVTVDPNNPSSGIVKNNGHPYTQWTDYGSEEAQNKQEDEEAIAEIESWQQLSGIPDNDPRLTITFTIAGSNLTEHPCYNVFKHAADLLNQCGFNIQVNPDINALTKLTTGSLYVWAAAWGSTIDPDMYQVYHKNSTASSVKAWGYPQILGAPSSYPQETSILNTLSGLIDDGRETTVEADRAQIYKNAMSQVLDLAVELPTYQRKTLYALNANVIDINTLSIEVKGGQLVGNSYVSPLSKIWMVDFVK